MHVGVFQGEKLRREKQLVRDVAEFLLLSQIPSFVSMFAVLLKLVTELLSITELLLMLNSDIIIVTVSAQFCCLCSLG